ncbi:nuclear receptor subfamily 2 group E member 1-like isoform X1 [Hermetia illucens]|uniref:nuclear receptor subfamily 2 group E member 1-like isoform X1 n=1 Tax=Hermetia illucens TaxID=343691 RepID=UPI0018CC3C24|nr:nuclear receptor subfamily 2 group E member 1-like isoform X1 [Hermetia illucens]XP_037907421.1 nuclear receptor subfamily 2 group E member 1-like isoform X1 [Hermetia illucens]
MLANDVKPTSGKEVLCKVCGDRASGKHYGVPSCDGCRGFFKRSIRRNLQYVCKEGGKCMIDVMRRNQCQACRFSKCLLVNMRREAVQHERAPRSSAPPPCNLVSIPFDFYTPQKALPVRPANILLPLPTLMPVDLVYKPIDSQFTTGYCGFQRELNILNPAFDKQQSSLGMENNNTINLSKTNDSFDRVNPLKGVSSLQTEDGNCKELIFESAAKLLYFAVKWARSIPHYNHLPHRDQSVLLENSWAELFLVMASQWGLPLESNLTISKELDNIRHVLQQFRHLKIDVAEASCLMALILFKAIPSLSTTSIEYISLVKDQSIAYLADKCGAFRLGHLLLLLPQVKNAAIPKFIQDTFFKGTVGEVAIERLLGDLI